MSRNSVEKDCTKRCKSKLHGQDLTNAITKRSVSDGALACFIKARCVNFAQAFDFGGRTPLHMAASRGRANLTNWLVRHSNEAFINARDRESGYTPLHRSIFYGQIHVAVGLLKTDANIDIPDKDDYKAIEHAMLDRSYMFASNGKEPKDVYVWGSNCNYTLGTGSQKQRNTPELLTQFAKQFHVTQVCLGKFHSIFLCDGTNEGEVYCCGHIARAGAAHSTALAPVPLGLREPCLQAAVTLTSTVFLMKSGMILQYTLNSFDNSSQSTTNTPSSIKLPNVKPILKLSHPLGVCSGRYHVVVWTPSVVYTWGQNYGQLGHSQEDKVIDSPKKVSLTINNKEECNLQLVSASDGATAVTTSRGDVYLFYRHLCKKIAVKQINLRQICVEAKVNEQGSPSRVTVILLTKIGQLLIWQDTTNKLTTCVFGFNHQITISHVVLTHDALYFTTKYGEAFIGYISRKSTPTQKPQPIARDRDRDNKSALVKFLEKDECTSIRVTKIPNIHRAVEVVSDSEGLNFACLQIKPTCGLTSLPELSPSSFAKNMETLLETASEEDLLHDVVFKVGFKSYPAHIYIIASSSPYLYKLYQEQLLNSPDEKPKIVLNNVLPEVFDRILKYMYTGTCDVAEIGPCALKIKREDIVKVKKEKENIDDLDLIENENDISAFEVYQKNNKNKKGNRNSNSNETMQQRSIYCEPVRLLQASAKRLHVMGLHKLLDNYYFKNGCIYIKDGLADSKNHPPVWNSEEHSELVDTNVCSKDGQLIPAHRCILAASLQYFNAMFMHTWTESKLLSTVSLPISYCILLPIIKFIYTDSCPEITCSENIDFICSMMIVSDQLFITKLKEICEIALANLVTLKNCTELCQFAHTYNATQLKQCCMEFISLNLSCILENRSLELLEDALLEDITLYYCKFNPIMSSRVITPFSDAVSDDVVNECAKLYPVDMNITDKELIKDINTVDLAKKKSRNKKIDYTDNEKARMRYESVSSVNSLDLSNDNSGDITLSLSNISKEPEKITREQSDKWTKVASPQQKQQKIVQSRLKAISNAKEILNETPVDNFIKLNSSLKSSPQDIVRPSSSRMSVSPKDVLSPETAWSPQGNLVINHVGPKMSQKQRKKLALQGSNGSLQNLENTFSNKMSLDSPPKAKNPWKICEPPIASSSPRAKTVGFNDILADQRKQKDNYSRIMTKPLALTQLEDKAIEELERFYSANEIDDELITVRRIELQVSSPQWIHTAPK